MLKSLFTLAAVTLTLVACGGQSKSSTNASTPQACDTSFVAGQDVRWGQSGYRTVAYDQYGNCHELTDAEMDAGEFAACGGPNGRAAERPMMVRSQQQSNWQIHRPEPRRHDQPHRRG